jgi:transposase
METMDFRALNPQSQETLRIKCVKQVLKGMPQTEASRVFGISRQAIIGWVKLYHGDGIKALKANPRGRPCGGSLKQWQAARIVKSVVDKTPDQLKLPFYLWTREAVAKLIEQRYEIRLSPWTIGRYLKRWGMTPQKPVRRAFEQNNEAVKKWLKEEYPQIRSQAKREKARIYWGDEMGLRSDHAVGRSFSMKGKTPVIYGTGQRFGCNMISAITNKGHLQFMVFKHRFNAGVFVGFLDRMKRQIPGKVYLIVDSHPAHRSLKVKNWQTANKRFKILFLPGYSPELNPDEMLNQDVKSNSVGRNRAHHQNELLSHVRGYLRSRQRQPEMVRNYFKEKHVQYAAV